MDFLGLGPRAPFIVASYMAGAFVLGALSGYGLMAANGAAELVAAHVCGERLPDYAAAFGLARYEDAAYRAEMEAWGDGGQL